MAAVGVEAGYVVGSRGSGERSPVQRLEQVVPSRIAVEDQQHLPGPQPVLHRVFALDGRADVVVDLKPDESREAVAAGESGSPLAVLVGAAGDVVRHAGVSVPIGRGGVPSPVGRRTG